MLLPSLLLSTFAAVAIWWHTRRNPAGSPRATSLVMILLLLLPLLTLLPKWEVTVASSSASAVTPLPWLFILWVTGIIVFGLRLSADYLAFSRWRKSARPLTQPTFDLASITQRQVRIHVHPSLSSPVVSGLLRPTIYLPEDHTQWPANTLRMAVLHELVHLERRDLWLAAAARLACVIHWFNPLVWWLRRALMTQCEYACDARVLQRGADRTAYAHALCDVASAAEPRAPSLALAMAGHIPLKTRILSLDQSGTSRRLPLITSTLLLLAISSALSLALVKFVPDQSVDLHWAPNAVDEATLRWEANPFPLD